MVKKLGVLYLILLWALLASCAAPEAQARPEPSAVESAAPVKSLEPRVQTATLVLPRPSLTPRPSASPTAAPPTLTATSTPPALPVVGKVITGRQALFAGPSTLFQTVEVLFYGDPIEIHAAAPGREWLLARAPGGAEGWIREQYVSVDLAVESLPLAAGDEGWVTVSGTVKDAGGKPVFGAEVVIYNASGRSTLAASWENGAFFLFVPREQQGDWQITVVGMECRNWATNPACRKPGRFADIPRTVRAVEDVTVEFVYR